MEKRGVGEGEMDEFGYLSIEKTSLVCIDGFTSFVSNTKTVDLLKIDGQNSSFSITMKLSVESINC